MTGSQMNTENLQPLPDSERPTVRVRTLERKKEVEEEKGMEYEERYEQNDWEKEEQDKKEGRKIMKREEAEGRDGIRREREEDDQEMIKNESRIEEIVLLTKHN
jgi:hypothetical protein